MTAIGFRATTAMLQIPARGTTPNPGTMCWPMNWQGMWLEGLAAGEAGAHREGVHYAE
jgi:hypothetical protein